MPVTANRGPAAPGRIHVSPDLCRDCQACTLACSLYHEGECNLTLARLLVNKDMARYEFQITICQQCDAPDCIPACPTDAMRRDGRGVVVLVDAECIQCGVCMASCPYGAIFYSESLGRYLKCDLCAGREEGPLCVEICPVGALALAAPAVEMET
jgi:carbon-monoxide dehydrogenase iron sulfur subunit